MNIPAQIAQAQTQAAPPQVAPVAPPQVPPVAFALTPARVTNTVLDYNNNVAIKIYKSAVQPLSTAFDVDSEGLNIFLAALYSKAREYGWDTILEIPRDLQAPLIDLGNILTNYGEFDLEHLRAFVSTYVATPTRVAQDSIMLYECIWNTLSKIGRSKVWIWKEEFYINAIPSGVLLLKIVIRESHIDTNATVRHLREKISSLDTFIATIGHDVEKFNAHVITVINGLKARGHTSQDVLANLFKAYKAVPDKEFVRYIKEKEDSYDDGTDITVEALMLRAADKFKRMVEAKEWKAPSPEQEKIIALEAAIKKLTIKQPKANPTSNSPNVNQKKNSKSGSSDRSKPQWMTKAPTTGSPQSKTVDGKEYFWCPKHKAWGRHKAKDCKGVGVKVKKNPTTDSNDSSNKDKNEERQLKLSRAMVSIVEDQE
jgi:hypothetical protein